jgi:hypothetical protein
MWTISSHTSLLWRTDADNAGDKLVTPMTLLPGRFRLATSPFYRVGCYPKDDRDTTARWSLTFPMVQKSRILHIKNPVDRKGLFRCRI